MASQDSREINQPIRVDGNDKEKGWFQKRRGVVIGVLIGLYALQAIAPFAVLALYVEELIDFPHSDCPPPVWLVLIMALSEFFYDFWWAIGFAYLFIGLIVWNGELDSSLRPNGKDCGWFQKRRLVVIGVLIGLYALQTIAAIAAPALYPDELNYIGPQRDWAPSEWLVMLMSFIIVFEDFRWVIGLAYIGVGLMVWTGALDRLLWRIAPFGTRPSPKT